VLEDPKRAGSSQSVSVLVALQQLRLCLRLAWSLEKPRIRVGTWPWFAISPHALGCSLVVPPACVPRCSCPASLLVVLCFSRVLTLFGTVWATPQVWFARTGKIANVFPLQGGGISVTGKVTPALL